jgi:hypothetical protein
MLSHPQVVRNGGMSSAESSGRNAAFGSLAGGRRDGSWIPFLRIEGAMTGRLHSVLISTITLCLAMTVGLAVLVAISIPHAAFATEKHASLAEPGGGGSGSADESHGDDDQPTITGRKDTQVENTRMTTVDGEPRKSDRGIQPQRDSGLRMVLERVELFVQFYLGVQR